MKETLRKISNGMAYLPWQYFLKPAESESVDTPANRHKLWFRNLQSKEERKREEFLSGWPFHHQMLNCPGFSWHRDHFLGFSITSVLVLTLNQVFSLPGSANEQGNKEPGGSRARTADLNCQRDLPHHRTTCPGYKLGRAGWEAPVTAQGWAGHWSGQELCSSPLHSFGVYSSLSVSLLSFLLSVLYFTSFQLLYSSYHKSCFIFSQFCSHPTLGEGGSACVVLHYPQLGLKLEQTRKCNWYWRK